MNYEIFTLAVIFKKTGLPQAVPDNKDGCVRFAEVAEERNLWGDSLAWVVALAMGRESPQRTANMLCSNL
jgi:hypothetical protein